MSLNFGGKKIGAVYVGGRKVKEAYLGSRKVYSSGLPSGTTFNLTLGANGTEVLPVDSGTWKVQGSRSFYLLRDGVRTGSSSSFVQFTSAGEQWSVSNLSSWLKNQVTVVKV